MMTEHLLPLFREYGVRYAQIARAGMTETDGIAVLDDSREPRQMHLRGPVSLSQEMVRAGTVPQVGGQRKCSLKWKGWPIDQFLAREMPGSYVQVMGYEAGERKRADKDKKANSDRRTGRYPLIEMGWDRFACQEYIRAQLGVTWPKSACVYCLAGETEVVTRQGVRQIRELAGGTHELLVPAAGTHGGLMHRGSFRPVPVRSFGEQRLYRVELRRSRSTKTVFATAEHRWILAPQPAAQWVQPATLERTTIDLEPGDRLKPLQAAAPSREAMGAFAVAQGFVYGDGSRLAGRNAPASLHVYDNGKDEALLPFFRSCQPRRTSRGWLVYGLPRSWKDLPDLAESRTFLLSWLAGYFAADGTVSRAGAATLYSASRAAIERARDIAAICGVGYSPIRTRLRVGTGTRPTPLHQINLSVHDLPGWFFLIGEHARRVKRLPERRPARQPWQVVSVQPTGRHEDVFCATVPGTAAFGLAEDLMTGNCPFALCNNEGRDRVLERYAENPHAGLPALMMEQIARTLNPRQGLAGSKRGNGSGLAAAKTLVGLLEADPRQQMLLRMHREQLEEAPWQLFEVQRAYRAPGQAPRRLRTLAAGSRSEMTAALRAEATGTTMELSAHDGIERAWRIRRSPGYPAAEWLLAAGPAGPVDKTGRGFSEAWEHALTAAMRALW